MEYKFLLDIGLIILFVKLFGIITGKIHMPKMLGGLIAGIVLGPAVLNIIELNSTLEFLEGLGIIFIMFLAGLETKLKQLMKDSKKFIIIAITGVLIPLAFGFLFSRFYIIDRTLNLFFGMVITATSVSITVESLMEMKKMKSHVGTAIIGAGVVDDIIGIIFLSFILNNGNVTVSSTITVVLKILIFLILALAIGLIMFKILAWLETKLKKSEELPIFSVAFALLLAYIAEVFGVSGIVGAYIAGLVVGRTKQGKEVRKRLEVLVHMIFSPISFASIGLKLNTLLLPVNTWLFIILFSVVTIFSKIIGAGLGAKITKYKTKEALQIGVGMVTRGEISFIMIEEAKKMLMITDEIFSILVITIAIVSFVTPIFLHFSFRKKHEEDEENLQTI